MSRHRIDPVSVSALVAALAGSRASGDGTVVLTGVTQDSRDVEPGDLYCCVVGERHDGHLLAREAVAAGAVALLAERDLHGVDVPVITVGSVRAALGPVAVELFGSPARGMRTVGVTGTNGKTSTTAMLGAILAAAGEKPVVVGTLTGERTTPEAIDLHATLRDARDAGATALAMEVSSHALAQRRTDGLVFDVGVLTNIGRDHLDFHRTQEEYVAAKARLFLDGLSRRAVVNLDDTYGRLIADTTAIPVAGFGIADAEEPVVGAGSVSFGWRSQRMVVPVGGRFTILNAVAAATAAAELGIDTATIAQGLASVGGIRGRFERIANDRDIDVVVDYAHTPEGLETLLSTAREVSRGRLIVVFGCGGDRDRGKRPLMGAVAARLADVVVVTSDNPRTEAPEAIIAEILGGTRNARAETRAVVDRADAIESAISTARRGDMVVVAGKGHETHQEVGDRKIPFDDADVARAALSAADEGGAR